MSYRPTDWDVLDLSADPTPGDADEVIGLARGLQWVSDEASASARGVRSLAGDQAVLAWVGAAADVFKPAIGDLPGQLDKLDRSYSLASDALGAFASSLTAAQAQADRALENGRTARRELDALQASLSSAQSGLTTATSGASALTSPAVSAPAPDPADVRAAVGKRVAAQQHVDSLSGQVGDAQHRLDLAKRLAQQAQEVRDDAADVAARRIGDAADAGIPPDSFWHKLGDALSQAWDVIITIAKVVVFIGSIVALIVGGPIAWIVVGAALLVLIDTLIKKSQGKASWFDVGMAVLNCIPITKGLTTVAALKDAFEAGGILGAGGHVLASAATAINSARTGLVTMWEGRSALPALLHAAPFTALGRLSNMATEMRYGATGSWTAFGLGVEDGAGVFGKLRSGFTGASHGWEEGRTAFAADVAAGDLPAAAARQWQTGGGYPGTDLWHNDTLVAGTNVEALSPGITGFVVPEGTMAGMGHDAAGISLSVQVAPSELSSTVGHNYRPEGITLHMQTDVSAASSTAHANVQYGAGGGAQSFIPNLGDHFASGDITMHAVDGTRLPVRVTDHGISVTVGAGQSIPLHNLDAGPGIPFSRDIAKLGGGIRNVTDFGGYGYQGYRAVNQGLELAR